MDARLTRLLLMLPLATLIPIARMIESQLWPNSDGVTPTKTFIGYDFVNIWTGSRLAADGNIATIYDFPAYNAFIHNAFGHKLDELVFSYMPNGLVLLLPFGQFDYAVSLALWTILGTAALIAAVLFRIPRWNDWPTVAIVLIAPIVWMNWGYGQMGLVYAAIFVAALRFLPTKPILAGALIGLLTIKPQLGIILPFALLALGQWRTFASATASTFPLVASSVAIFGTEAWQLYYANIHPLQSALMLNTESAFAFHNVSMFFGLRLIGVSETIALIIHGACAIAVLSTTVLSCRSDRLDWPLKALIIATASVMVSPYVLACDLTIPTAALLWYLTTRPHRPAAADFRFVGLSWLLPVATNYMLQREYGIPTGALVMGAFYIWLMAQAYGWNTLKTVALRPSVLLKPA